MVNITLKPGAHDGEIKDNPSKFPAGLVYLALQAEASDDEYSGFVSGWVRPELSKLVKAAPELLEALQALWAASEGSSDAEIDARLKARFAINKAIA